MLFWVLLACSGAPADADADGDGVPDADDCAPLDADRYPGAPEYCRSGTVDDCDMTEDEAHAFCALWREVSAEESSGVFVGSHRGDRAGASVRGVGDVTGDGVVDWATGAPGAGAVFVMSGAMHGHEDLGVAEAVLSGEADGEAGTALAGPGDLDGDGVSDLVVAAPGTRGDAQVYVVSGPVSGEQDLGDAVVTADPGVGSVLAVGDVTGDGAADLVLGAGTLDVDGAPAAGAVYVVEGPFDPRTLGEEDRWLVGDARDAGVGTAVAVGDLDGDGVMDLAVGAPGLEDDPGQAAVLYGPFAGLAEADLVLTGADSGSGTGVTLASGGDVDGDGRDDLVVGAPGYDGRGAAYLVTDPASGPIDLVAEAVFDAVRAADSAGAAVAILGDVDADDYADIGIGAPDIGDAAGGGYVVFGPVLGNFDLADSDISITTTYDGDAMGYVLGGAGDLDGDGRDDFLFGSPLHSNPEDEGGVVWLFLAAPI